MSNFLSKSNNNENDNDDDVGGHTSIHFLFFIFLL